jgi:hypothetical protein
MWKQSARTPMVQLWVPLWYERFMMHMNQVRM